LEPLTKKHSTGNGNGVRMAGGERRLQILRVAMRLFSQRGFRGATTKEIAVAAGVSEAMVFRHFATKEELYSAIIDYKACADDALDPFQLVADALKLKDDRAVFERLAFNALEKHESDPEFQRLLLHSALEEHGLAEMFWDKFVKRVYAFLGAYVRERQRDGAMIGIEPAMVVRAFIGMVMHHSLNNNLWDPKRRLLKISNQKAARAFTDILLLGVTSKTAWESLDKSPQNGASASRRGVKKRSNGNKAVHRNSDRKRSSK
jgi:AcrR family transcriptional regulator